MRPASAELQYAVDEHSDPRELLVGHRGIPAAHLRRIRRRRRAQVDELEQTVHRIADLGRGQPALARTCGPLCPQACDALDVVAVRAPVVQRERRVGQPADPVQRRRIGQKELGQAVAARRRVGPPPAARRTTRAGPSPATSSSSAGSPRTASPSAAPASPSSPRSTRRRKRASPRASSTGSDACSTSACAASRPSTQPIGVSRSCGRSGSIAPDTISRSTARVIAT